MKKSKHQIKLFHDLLSRLPETFKRKKDAEDRAEYLRIGTFKNSYVEKCDAGWRVIKAI